MRRSLEARERRHERVLASLRLPLHREVARVGFITAALLADFLLPPEAWERSGDVGPALALAVLAVLVTLEIWLYRRLFSARARA